MFKTLTVGHTPSTAGTFRKKFRKNSGKTPETLSERFLEFPSRVRLGCPKPYNSRHLRLPERFQNSLPPSTAGDASFFRIGSGEGLSEPVMEFPAVLGVFLKLTTQKIEKPNFCTLFLKKAIFRNCQVIGHPKKHKLITEQKHFAWNNYIYIYIEVENDLGPVNNPYLDQLITIKKARLGPVNNYSIYIYIQGVSLKMNPFFL